jgi:hypothetical protein
MARRRPTPTYITCAKSDLAVGTRITARAGSLWADQHIGRGGQVATITKIYNSEYIDVPFWADVRFDDGTEYLKIGLDAITSGAEFELIR